MLKLTASYSKKVPASEEYSSQHYHAGVELEIPDNLPPAELRRRIQTTFAMVRESVESELHKHADRQQQHHQQPAHPPADQRPADTTTRRASQKQVKYLIDLAARNGYDLGELDRIAYERCAVDTVHDLSKHQASKLIDSLSARPDRRAA
jgi:hypothetical protein